MIELDPRELPPILAEVRLPDPEPSVREQLRQWLAERLGRIDVGPVPEWLPDLGHLLPPASLVERGLQALLVALLAAAVLTLAARLLRLPWREWLRRRRPPEVTPLPPVPVPARGSRAAGPGVWLERLLHRCVQAELLPDSAALTNREAQRHLAARAPELAAALAELLRELEPALYGGLELEPDRVTRLESKARELEARCARRWPA